MKNIDWKDWLFCGGTIVLVFVFLFYGAGAFAEDALLSEAEEDGLSVLEAALIALVTAVGGFFGREGVYRWHGRNGASGGGEDALVKHERECAKRYAEVHEKISEVREAVARLEGKLDRFTGG